MSATPGNTDPTELALDHARAAANAGDWIGARAHSLAALHEARRERDFGAMARAIELYRPASANIVERAENASEGALIIARGSEAPDPLTPGCYLVQPPMIGADAARLREAAFAGGLPVRVLAREPLTRDSLWPVVAVGDVIVRARVAPPTPLDRVESEVTKDSYPGPAPLAWFRGALDTLARSALDRLDPDEPAQHRVDDLLEYLSALPEHDGVIDALSSACAEAQERPAPTLPRRRPVIDDPHSF